MPYNNILNINTPFENSTNKPYKMQTDLNVEKSFTYTSWYV